MTAPLTSADSLTLSCIALSCIALSCIAGPTLAIHGATVSYTR